MKTGSGWDVTWLGSYTGWLMGSAYPTWNRNSVLIGHNYNADGTPGIFFNFDKNRWEDKIIIRLYEQSFVFEVRRAMDYINPSDVKTLLTQKDNPWLTLVTCRGYDAVTGTYQWRILVRAVLVKVV